jgi:hypothetical protein
MAVTIPTIITSTAGSVGWNSGTGPAHALSAVSANAGDVLTLMVDNAAPTPTNFETVSSVSGGGLTWQRYGISSLNTGAYNPSGSPTGGVRVEVWWAQVPATLSSATITVTMSGSLSDGGAVCCPVRGCANPSAPWDTHPSLPATFAGTFPSSTTYSTASPQVLVIGFNATSRPGSDTISVVPAPWVWGVLGGGGSMSHFSLQDALFRMTPTFVLGPIPAPNAFGCDPRTPTSLTATWSAVAPRNYPVLTNAPVSIHSTGTLGVSVSLVGALVGTTVGNTVSYEVDYYPTVAGTPVLSVTTSATSALLSGLAAGVDYSWHVYAIDTSGSPTSPYSGLIACPMTVPPPTLKLAMDDVVCTATTTQLSTNLISLRWSDDRGHSYGSPVSQSIGEAGEYRTSLQWQRLAYARDRVFEISWSVPMRTALQGCWVDVTPAQS